MKAKIEKTCWAYKKEHGKQLPEILCVIPIMRGIRFEWEIAIGAMHVNTYFGCSNGTIYSQFSSLRLYVCGICNLLTAFRHSHSTWRVGHHDLHAIN